MSPLSKIYLSSPHMGEGELKYVNQAFATNWIAPLGPLVEQFERVCADHAGLAFGAATCSGTAALHLALTVAGVKEGDLVLVSSLTFIGSANPILYLGAKPVFVDSEPESWNMCPEALKRAIHWAKSESKLPKALVVVNLYGQSAQMDPIIQICKENNIILIEDAAESLGAKYKGKPSGGFGDLSFYSFNGNKIITTSGGGMLLSNREDWIHQARFLSTQARDPAPHYQHSQMGFNYRLSNVLAGIGLGQMEVLEKRVATRRAIFERYREHFEGPKGLQFMPEMEGSFSTRWLTVATLGSQARTTAHTLLNQFGLQNIECRPVWKPLHLQPLFEGCAYFPYQKDFDFSKSVFENGLCLPSGSNMTPEQWERIRDVLDGALK